MQVLVLATVRVVCVLGCFEMYMCAYMSLSNITPSFLFGFLESKVLVNLPYTGLKFTLPYVLSFVRFGKIALAFRKWQEKYHGVKTRPS